jgi:hypothetical protein
MSNNTLRDHLQADIARVIVKRLFADQNARPNAGDERMMALLELVSDVMGGVYFGLGLNPDEFAQTASQASVNAVSAGQAQMVAGAGIYAVVAQFVPVVHMVSDSGKGAK